MENNSKSALLLIDVQKGFRDSSYWGQRNNPKLEENITDLLEAYRANGNAVIHIQHRSIQPNSPLRPGQSGVEFMDFALPKNDEPVFTKTVNSAFIGTSLERYLRDQVITNLTIVGLTSDHCVSTSTRMAANLGFTVTIAEDAVATFGRTGFDGTQYSADLVHHLALASLKDEFSSIESTRHLIARLT